jgi:hypothetical protein
MHRSEPRMNTTIDFVEHLNGLSAQGQGFFVRRQGHGSMLRPTVFTFTTEAARRADYIGVGIAQAIRIGGAVL